MNLDKSHSRLCFGSESLSAFSSGAAEAFLREIGAEAGRDKMCGVGLTFLAKCHNDDWEIEQNNLHHFSHQHNNVIFFYVALSFFFIPLCNHIVMAYVTQW